MDEKAPRRLNGAALMLCGFLRSIISCEKKETDPQVKMLKDIIDYRGDC
jgi:hypothetical protein